MPYYRHVGEVPRKRHSYVPVAGGYLFEELMGHEGFAAGIVAAVPPALAERDRARSRPWTVHAVSTTLDHPLQPRHLRTDSVPVTGDAIGDRTVLFAQRRRAHRLVRGDHRQRSVPRRDRRPTRLRAVGHRHAGVELRRADGRARRLRRDPDRRHPPLARRALGSADGARPRIVRPRRASRASTSPIAASSARDRRSPSATCAAPRARSSARTATSPSSCAAAPGCRASCTRRIRSTSSAGTAACSRSRSPSTTSSRSSAPGISRRRCTRRSRATASSSARSCRARSTSAKAR